MLRTSPIRAYIPASDVKRARKFYEEIVGLMPKEEYAGGVIYECGGAEVFMYPASNLRKDCLRSPTQKLASAELQTP
jgi:catechol-2,3-dioxygenase